MRIITMLMCCILSCSVLAETIKINSKNASLQFSGEHAGRAFTGKFNEWQATLMLPPETEPRIEAQFSLASAETGNAMYDETLVEDDWFNVKNTPTAKFVTSDIAKTDSGYMVKGELSLRGISHLVTFALTRNQTGLSAEFDIDRLAFGIGKESDPDAEWVSREIGLRLTIPN